MQRSPLALAPYPTFPAISLALMWLVKGHILFREIKSGEWWRRWWWRRRRRGGSFTSPSACAAAAGLPNITTARFQTLEVSQRFAPPAPPTVFFPSHICLGPLDKMPPFDSQPEPFLSSFFFAGISGCGPRCG